MANHREQTMEKLRPLRGAPGQLGRDVARINELRARCPVPPDGPIETAYMNMGLPYHLWGKFQLMGVVLEYTHDQHLQAYRLRLTRRNTPHGVPIHLDIMVENIPPREDFPAEMWEDWLQKLLAYDPKEKILT